MDAHTLSRRVSEQVNNWEGQEAFVANLSDIIPQDWASRSFLLLELPVIRYVLAIKGLPVIRYVLVI